MNALNLLTYNDVKKLVYEEQTAKVIYDTIQGIILNIREQKAFYYACEENKLYGTMPEVSKKRTKISKILFYLFDIDVNPEFDEEDYV